MWPGLLQDMEKQGLISDEQHALLRDMSDNSDGGVRAEANTVKIAVAAELFEVPYTMVLDDEVSLECQKLLRKNAETQTESAKHGQAQELTKQE
jgi:hypothetical protein